METVSTDQNVTFELLKAFLDEICLMIGLSHISGLPETTLDFINQIGRLKSLIDSLVSCFTDNQIPHESDVEWVATNNWKANKPEQKPPQSLPGLKKKFKKSEKNV